MLHVLLQLLVVIFQRSVRLAARVSQMKCCLPLLNSGLFGVSKMPWFFASVLMAEEGFPHGDKLILRGMIFHGFHGVKPEEKKLGQKFLLDVDAWLDLQKAGVSDHLTDTVSYSDIYRIARAIVEGPSHDLLESVAHEIAMTAFERHPLISVIRVRVGKPHVAVPSTIDYLGIEILRHNKKSPST